MLGAIIGDIAGSRFEFNNARNDRFRLFTGECSFTDDTICTVAVADAILKGGSYGESIHGWCRRYPHPMGGYGGSFARWVHSDNPQPYGSFGNGSAMRVSPIGWLFGGKEDVEREAAGQGAVVADAYMTDTKVWAETILPEPFVIPTQNNGDVVIFAGARFSTSDYGDGSIDMRSFLLNGACLNGMVRESVMRQVHLGSKLPDNLALSQRTYELDTQTTVSAVRDLTQGLYSKDNLLRKAHEIQGASEMVVDLDNEVKKLTRDGAVHISREPIERKHRTALCDD